MSALLQCCALVLAGIACRWYAERCERDSFSQALFAGCGIVLFLATAFILLQAVQGVTA